MLENFISETKSLLSHKLRRCTILRSKMQILGEVSLYEKAQRSDLMVRSQIRASLYDLVQPQ
jgi:hypothetical protein